MGLFDIFKKKKQENLTAAQMLNGTVPIFSQFGQNIYASDIVQAAISRKVSELMKLHIKVVRYTPDGGDEYLNDNVQTVLDNPNQLMTSSDFISKISWSLFLNYNAFIYPEFEYYKDAQGNTRRRLIALYPLNPIYVEFQRDSEDNLYIKFRFNNGKEAILEYSQVIHIKYKFSVNDFMGGNRSGQPDNDALLKTLEINHNVLESVKTAINWSFKLDGIIKYNTMLDKKKLDPLAQEFINDVIKGDKSVLTLDNTMDYTALSRNIKLVDAETLKFLDDKILRVLGVPLAILTGDYTKAQYEAFYQSELEPLAKVFSEAFTKVLFTTLEYARGKRIKFYPEELVFLNSETKEKALAQGINIGAITINEWRRAWGMPPIEGGSERIRSLNYVNAAKADQYQLDEKTPSAEEDNKNE